MAQQNNGNQSRQSTSYPSPHSYPSPSMSAFAFPGGPPQQGQMGGQQNVEQYRASPTGSHGSLASLNLPPIRSIDPRQPQGGPQQQQQPMQGSPLPPGLANMAPIGQFYPHPGQTLAPQQHMNITSSPLPVRYPIPASDAQKVISGGRHKKEVKRRTKTGCLTCRKRRIKCDEGHPTCRNCKKSKRECLGYDPIFKPQPAPTAIQPAPNASSHPPPNQPYPPPPQGYVPVSQNFAHSLSSGVDSPSSSLSQFDYGAPIDPALEGAGSSQMAAPNAFDGGQTYPPPVKAETSTFPSTADGQNQKAKRIKIDELFSLQGIKPPGILPPSSISPERLEEIKNLYLNTYAPAIDKFLEVQWYSSKSLPKLLADSALCSRFSTMLDYFASNMPDKNSYIQAQSLETSVMWSLMDMSSSALTPLNGTSSKEEGNEMTDARDAAEKLKVFAALLTGQTLDRNPMSPAHELANGTALRDQMKGRSSQFWSSMGYYLTQHDDQASAEDEIEKTLSACRKVLDNFENRDVIYSIAVVRHLGHRFPDFPSSLPKSKTNDEREAEARINVAKQFLEDEAAGKGTTQVIQRLCAMAIQSWYVRR